MNEIDACWVLTTGEAGMRSQAMGLAEAVGLPIVEKRIVVRRPWSWLPGGLLPDAHVRARSGRRPAGAALAAAPGELRAALDRRGARSSSASRAGARSPPMCRTRSSPERSFDLVAAMPHDGVTGPNVVTVRTALHPRHAGAPGGRAPTNGATASPPAARRGSAC